RHREPRRAADQEHGHGHGRRRVAERDGDDRARQCERNRRRRLAHAESGLPGGRGRPGGAAPPRRPPTAQPLTAPAVRPATIRFWKSRTMMISGTEMTTDAAEMLPNGTSCSVAPVKNAIAAGTVRAF